MLVIIDFAGLLVFTSLDQLSAFIIQVLAFVTLPFVLQSFHHVIFPIFCPPRTFYQFRLSSVLVRSVFIPHRLLSFYPLLSQVRP